MWKTKLTSMLQPNKEIVDNVIIVVDWTTNGLINNCFNVTHLTFKMKYLSP